MSGRSDKKERRKQRYLRNLEKDQTHKKEAWENGKLIEPNHNNGPYPADYSVELGKRLCTIIKKFKQTSKDNEAFLLRFRLYKIKIRDFILHYNPNIPKTEEYFYLKNLLENYWDNPNNLINIV